MRRLIRIYNMSGLFGDKVAQGDVAAHKEIHMVVYFRPTVW